jgi:predicted glycogen debranching enzyme
MILVNGFDAAIETPAGSFWISSQEYSTDTIAPDGADCLADFQPEPWPRWTYRLSDGTVVEQEVFVPRGRSAVFLRWKLLNSDVPATLHVRPFISGRDYHSLHHENGGFRFDADTDGDRVTWRPYDGVPAVSALSNGQYHHEPTWYRNFVYEAERERGLDDTEDLAAPGVFSWDLAAGEALLVFAAEGHEGDLLSDDLSNVHARVRKEEADRRSKFPSRLHHSADAYIVDGRHGKTVVAGFPWFTDWGRDTFIALRGLCLATGRLDDARDILVAWAGAVDEGMLPNDPRACLDRIVGLFYGSRRWNAPRRGGLREAQRSPRGEVRKTQTPEERSSLHLLLRLPRGAPQFCVRNPPDQSTCSHRFYYTATRNSPCHLPAITI